MNGKSTAATTRRAKVLQIQIKKQSDALAKTILEYLRVLGMSGIRTPSPPRPMREVVASTDYSARLCDAFRASGSTGIPD